ncbi:MAG: radical SAM protein [Thermodesulfobacteriota bacterium]
MKATARSDTEGLRLIHQEPTGQVRLVEFEQRFFEVMNKHFGERFRRYRDDWNQTSKFAFRPDFPLSLDLEINTGCNLKCVMCVLGSEKSYRSPAPAARMDLSLYRNLMAQARQWGLPAMTFGYLSEPLLNPDLVRLISLAREAGVMDIRLGTNGQLLYPEISRNLIQAGLTRLEVSLDALRPETYRRIRRGGDLENVIQNILDFLEARDRSSSDLPLLRLSFLRLPFNEDELAGFLDFWRDKADLFSIQEPIYFSEAPIARELHLRPGPVNPDFFCAQPWQRLIVRANGDVFPCCSLFGLEMKAGSALKTGLDEIWRSPFLVSLSRMLQEGRYLENGPCALCARQSSLQAVRTPKITVGVEA